MRDGIEAAKRGLPAVAFVTDDFWKQGIFVANAQGMPDIPRVKLPHPVAGTGRQAMQELADRVVDEVIGRLQKP